PQSIEIVYDDALERRFCGSGLQSTHTTFEGDVDVAFTAAAPGAPPVTATLPKVIIDFRPPIRQARAEAEAAEGTRTPEFLGLHASEDAPPSGGILIASVDRARPAAEAGIIAGDLITSFEGVKVHSPTDMRVSGERATATIAVRRTGGSRDVLRTI